MRRSARDAFALALAALVLASPAGAKKDGKAASPEDRTPGPTWYAQALSRGPAGLNVTHFWSKGASLRAETVIAGHKVVTIVHGETYYTYDEILGTGMAIGRSPEALAVASPDRRPFGNEASNLVRQGAELVGEEDILGRRCDVYRLTDQRGRREVWVTKDAARLPLRIKIYHRSSGTWQYTDYLNWQTAIPVPDAFFQPDPTIQLVRFTFDEYMRATGLEGPQGPVPVLYGDLLRGPDS